MEGVGFVSGSGALGLVRNAGVRTCQVPTMVATTATGKQSKFEAMRKKYGVAAKDLGEVGFSYDEFDAAVADYEYNLTMGETVVGKIFECTARGALVDIGAKAAGWLPADEFATAPVEVPSEYFAPETAIELIIASREDSNGQLTLSLRRLEFQRCWDRVIQLQSEDVPVFCEVVSVNRGGVLVKIQGLRGFIPQSHAGDLNMVDAEVGRQISVKFLEVDPAKNRLVLSKKLASASRKMNNFAPGQVVEGVVSGTKPYGLFVDVDGVSGLLHISQISHSHIPDVAALVDVGQPIKCMVLNQDKNKGRMSLSTKVLENEPGDMVKDPEKVFAGAEEVAQRYREKLEAEKKASAEVAEEIVSALDFARV
uniref:S1 motif domain-containing protein n=2 Tax=Rhodosorus marinus TaxID=101924 RepID=A0A7S3A139_9RHOD|mmetsp:Transcript_40709/g.161367  ORF Transcript_40709/g.161367 Transcript_40709/m.161367 type:complete len:367 (+) Transcript_40709:243-1343(+)